MARTAKQILMAQGYTEAELASSSILADARLVRSLEAEDAAIEARMNGFQSERDQAKALLDKTDKWYQETAVPTIEKTNREAVAARARVAQLEAQLKAEAELGLRRVAEQDGGTGAGGTGAGANPNPNPNPAGDIDPRYVTADIFRNTADQVGDGMASMADLAEEHRELFGKRLEGGVAKLRKDWKNAQTTQRFQGDMYEYWRTTHKVDEQRAALATKAAADHEASIRADERAKATSEMLNPMTRAMQSSNNPFTRKKIEGGTTDGKQPWDVASREQRASARVMKFGTAELNKANTRTA